MGVIFQLEGDQQSYAGVLSSCLSYQDVGFTHFGTLFFSSLHTSPKKSDKAVHVVRKLDRKPEIDNFLFVFGLLVLKKLIKSLRQTVVRNSNTGRSLHGSKVSNSASSSVISEVEDKAALFSEKRGPYILVISSQKHIFGLTVMKTTRYNLIRIS